MAYAEGRSVCVRIYREHRTAALHIASSDLVSLLTESIIVIGCSTHTRDRKTAYQDRNQTFSRNAFEVKLH